MPGSLNPAPDTKARARGLCATASVAGLHLIGAPGFEPGTSPTRIMGDVWGRHKKVLQIGGFRCEPIALRSSDIAVDSRGLGSEIELLPNARRVVRLVGSRDSCGWTAMQGTAHGTDRCVAPRAAERLSPTKRMTTCALHRGRARDDRTPARSRTVVRQRDQRQRRSDQTHSAD
jgi:hypothetical protein